MIDFILKIPLRSDSNNLADLFYEKPVINLHYINDFCEFIAWGDPITAGDIANIVKETVPESIINNIYGHYYFLYLNKIRKEICFGNSLFSILPIYYYAGKEVLSFSNKVIKLGENAGLKKISKRFILETILFNYTLFNNSIIDGISLVPSNSFVSIKDGSWNLIKHSSIQDYFSSAPVSWRAALKGTSELFLNSIKKYLPETTYLNSLTGGFDGRTLVSAGLFHKRNFSCYCFGTSDSKDVEIAKELSRVANIPLRRIDLDREYILDNSLSCGLEFVENSSGTAAFSRAHYLYSAQKVKDKFDIIITGNFGSEIFRAAHVPGVVISPNLYILFNNVLPEKALSSIWKSKEAECLNKESYKNEWEQFQNEITLLPCFNKDFQHLSKNQRFYIFVFEEVFRKYFGAELVNQFMYLKNRTPFLDIDFLRAIFNTDLSGIHSGFFEHNPVKRYKGQVFYAYLINNTYPEFGKVITDKGYRPVDLFGFQGKIRILGGYARRKIRGNHTGYDPYGVNQAFKINREYFKKINIIKELFSADRIYLDEPVTSDESVFRILSLSYMIEQLLNPDKNQLD